VNLSHVHGNFQDKNGKILPTLRRKWDNIMYYINEDYSGRENVMNQCQMPIPFNMETEQAAYVPH